MIDIVNFLINPIFNFHLFFFSDIGKAVKKSNDEFYNCWGILKLNNV